MGAGSDISGMMDLKLDERLLRYINGGKIMDDPPSMRNPSENEQNKCSSIKEGDTVNLYVTFPGAIMALTMIHL